MSDKEVRYGIADHRRTGRWRRRTPRTARSTAATTRSPPSGGAVPIVNMFTGEVIFGGVGSGLYGMLFFVLIAVFIAGLMVGRTPEYLGKKIEAREIKLAAVGALFVPTMVLVLTAISVVTDRGLASIFNPGRARLLRGALRLRLAVEQQRQRLRRLRRDRVLGARWARSRSGSAASCRSSPRSRSAARWPRRRPCRPRPAPSAPTAPTFAVLLVGVIVLTAGLMIFPALTLGPIVEALS